MNIEHRTSNIARRSNMQVIRSVFTLKGEQRPEKEDDRTASPSSRLPEKRTQGNPKAVLEKNSQTQMKGRKDHGREKKYLRIVVAAVVLLFVATAATIVCAETYNMTGTISAIDLPYQTVVIKCPLASKQIFTVGGPLAENAKLIIKNKKASLNDFKVGDRVAVRWHGVPQGHMIDRLVLQ